MKMPERKKELEIDLGLAGRDLVEFMQTVELNEKIKAFNDCYDQVQDLNKGTICVDAERLRDRLSDIYLLLKVYGQEWVVTKEEYINDTIAYLTKGEE